MHIAVRPVVRAIDRCGTPVEIPGVRGLVHPCDQQITALRVRQAIESAQRD